MQPKDTAEKNEEIFFRWIFLRMEVIDLMMEVTCQCLYSRLPPRLD